MFRNKLFVIVYFASMTSLVTCNATRRQQEAEFELSKHRIDLLEEGLKTYVYQSMPKIELLEAEVDMLRKENGHLADELYRQQKEIETLNWATIDAVKYQLSKEDKDLVTELKWTIFDLKEANRELQLEACLRHTSCGEWQEWSACSNECGSGARVRVRDCNQTGRFSSMCSPENFQEERCHERSCSPQCPGNYTLFEGHCFRFSGRQDTRLLSTLLCEEDKAHLALIDSDAKQKIVWDYIGMAAPEHMVDLNEDFSQREFWDFKDIDQKTNVAIDGVRKHQKTTFQNWRGNEMTYFHWATGEPRNDRSDGDYCATLNVLTGEWYMKCCSVTFFYVCEIDLAP